jgi:glutaryl-CoA dehydrogenase
VAATQSAQMKLADMARRITLAQMLVLQLGRLKDAGHEADPGQPGQVEQLPDGDRHRPRMPRLLGGAGITTEYCPIRHRSTWNR